MPSGCVAVNDYRSSSLPPPNLQYFLILCIHWEGLWEFRTFFPPGCSIWGLRDNSVISSDHIFSSSASQTMSAWVKKGQISSTYHLVCSRGPWKRMVSFTCHQDSTSQLHYKSISCQLFFLSFFFSTLPTLVGFFVSFCFCFCFSANWLRIKIHQSSARCGGECTVIPAIESWR